MALPQIINPEDFEKLSMRELVEWFNGNIGEGGAVKTFRTLAVGVLRCKNLMRQLDEEIELEEATEGMTDEEFRAYVFRNMTGEEDSELARNVAHAITEATMPGDERVRRSSILHDERLPRVKFSGNSESVAASWADEATAKARSTRHHVKVAYGKMKEKTETFGSVRKAFHALGLPESKHIRFRGKLKKSGHEVFEHNSETFVFYLVEK